MMIIALVAGVATFQPNQLQRFEVYYHDLNLARSADIRTLGHRVARVAEQICAPSKAEPDYDLPHELKECWEEVIARARPQVRAAVTKARLRRTASMDGDPRP